jgi:FMN phosphatase YigB (HAD superfamily)
VAEPTHRLILVSDFDGTLYRGDAPIRRYARGAAEKLPAPARTALLEAVDRYLAHGVRAADDAADPVEAEALRASVDGWDAVALLAGRCHQVAAADLDAAFYATRAYMTSQECVLEVPDGYRALLADLRAEGVRVVLATNSPPDGLDPLLDRLGVRPLLDEVIASTGKPAGLGRLLRAELGDGEGVDPSHAARGFAIGDHWPNDIGPARELAVPTGYIDRYGRADGPATATAPDVEGLLPALRAWADTPAALGA